MGKDVAADCFLFALDRFYIREHAVRLEPLRKLSFKVVVNRIEDSDEIWDEQTKTDGIAV